jgi:hypothetical protein
MDAGFEVPEATIDVGEAACNSDEGFVEVEEV